MIGDLRGAEVSGRKKAMTMLVIMSGGSRGAEVSGLTNALTMHVIMSGGSSGGCRQVLHHDEHGGEPR
jgi:hypothetical protein